MQFIIDNWQVLLLSVIAGAGASIGVFYFTKNSTAAQLANVKEWLVWAVTGAEKELGGGTGQLKLRQVYDLFLLRFPKLAAAISFDTFSKLVDEALEVMRKMLETNAAVQKFVAGGDSNAESA